MLPRTSPSPIRIVIADDHGLFRAGVHALLDEHADLHVVAELEDGRTVCDIVERTNADILLLDLDMPHVDGYQVLRELRERGIRTRPIVLTAIRDPEPLTRAVELGARGVVAKKGATRNMIEAIRAVHSGLRWMDPSLKILRVAEKPAAKSTNWTTHCLPNGWNNLTAREREVAQLVAEGHRYKEVAQRLNISEHTLKNHLRHIFEKLAIRSRVQLALSGRSTAGGR